ncbi:ABC transporter permease [candidate division FCPU426 bacterium]|nr:ABC transporter permease [candidate division FCPU426 bacterium]
MLERVLAAEFLKLRRSKITWISWLAFSIMPLATGLFVWIVKEPGRAAQLGLLGQKASLTGVTADWPGYFKLLNQAACAGSMVLLAIIVAYIFGREYSDGTAKNMLTLPVGRHWFAIAKLIVAIVWFGALLASIIAEGFLVGTWLGLPGLTFTLAAAATGRILFAGLIGYLLVPMVAWMATLGRGYLPPIGFTIFMLLMGNILGATGWGKWFPWAIVPMLAGMAGPRVEVLAPGSLAVVGITFFAGVALTIWQLRFGDNTQ